jgi:hypothetical protein
MQNIAKHLPCAGTQISANPSNNTFIPLLLGSAFEYLPR